MFYGRALFFCIPHVVQHVCWGGGGISTWIFKKCFFSVYIWDSLQFHNVFPQRKLTKKIQTIFTLRLKLFTLAADWLIRRCPRCLAAWHWDDIRMIRPECHWAGGCAGRIVAVTRASLPWISVSMSLSIHVPTVLGEERTKNLNYQYCTERFIAWLIDWSLPTYRHFQNRAIIRNYFFLKKLRF